MSNVLAAAYVIGVIVMSMATLQAGRAQESLRVGDPFPELKGRFLTGRDAALPQAASGKVTLVAMGFTYQSRYWKKRLAHSPEREDDAHLIVFDRDGIVQWLHHGGFDQPRADDLRGLLTSLADGRTTMADHDLAHRRSEP